MLQEIRQYAYHLGLTEADLLSFAREIAPDDCVSCGVRCLEDLSRDDLAALVGFLHHIEADSLAAV